MRTTWRIVKEKYAAQAFDGEGARRNGGRWNSPGTPMVYTSQSASLAVLEMLVHLENAVVLPAYRLCAAHFEESLVQSVDEALLPINWRDAAGRAALQSIGDAWTRGRTSVVLRVPSAVLPFESNFLLNPLHPDFKTLHFDEPIAFEFDRRLTLG